MTRWLSLHQIHFSQDAPGERRRRRSALPELQSCHDNKGQLVGPKKPWSWQDGSFPAAPPSSQPRLAHLFCSNRNTGPHRALQGRVSGSKARPQKHQLQCNGSPRSPSALVWSTRIVHAWIWSPLPGPPERPRLAYGDVAQLLSLLSAGCVQAWTTRVHRAPRRARTCGTRAPWARVD